MEHGSRVPTVPVHGNQTLKIGTLRSILRNIDIDCVGVRDGLELVMLLEALPRGSIWNTGGPSIN